MRKWIWWFHISVFAHHLGRGGGRDQYCNFFFAAQRGLWFPHSLGFSRSHTIDAAQSVGLLWTSDKLVAETSTWQHTTPTTDRHPCSRWDSNPQSLQARGRRLSSGISNFRPPLWSSGQSFWLQIQRSSVRFPALPDFLSSSGSGTGSTQPREVNWGATWIKSSGSGPENRD